MSADLARGSTTFSACTLSGVAYTPLLSAISHKCNPFTLGAGGPMDSRGQAFRVAAHDQRKGQKGEAAHRPR